MNIMLYLKRLSLFILLLSISQPTLANLIINGGFEAQDVPNRSWRYFDPDNTPGLGWKGSNVEIWDSLFRFEASEGKQHGELNAHPNQRNSFFSIFQTFNTVIGQDYYLSFDYAGRRSNNESFKALVYSDENNKILDLTFTDHTPRVWSSYYGMFTADDTSTTLRFTSENKGTRGNLLDNVKVTAIPEPNVLFAMLFLICFMGYQVKKRSNNETSI